MLSLSENAKSMPARHYSWHDLPIARITHPRRDGVHDVPAYGIADLCGIAKSDIEHRLCEEPLPCSCRSTRCSGHRPIMLGSGGYELLQEPTISTINRRSRLSPDPHMCPLPSD